MTITLTHKFVSAIPDGADATVVRPSNWNDTHDVSGTLPIANGGTNTASVPANGQLLIGNGTDYTVANLTAGTGVTITNTAGGITLSAPDNGTVTGVTASSPLASSGGTAPNISLTGTVPVANGGTGAATLTGYVIGNGTSAMTASATIPTSNLTGTLPVANGGTGQTTYTDGQLLIGNTTGNTLAKATLTAGTGVTITNGPGTITISAPDTGTVTAVTASSPLASSGGATPNLSLTGTVAIANGGTAGTATPTAGAVPYGTGTAYAFSAAGTTGQVLTSAGAGAPTWTTPTTGTVTSVTASSPLSSSGGATPDLSLTGTVPIANGGTNATATPTAGAIAYGTGTAYAFTAAGTTGQVLTSNGAGVPTWAAAASGTVTSVAQSFTGGLISVSGSPITSSGTLALTVTGTSGGIPYFSSGTTWATSAALAANALMVGGGAGAAPSTVTTGTGVVTALGVNTGTAGAFVVNGGALGTPSSGTATNLSGTAASLTAGAATNIAGGAAGQIPRQTGAGATGFTTATFPTTAGASGNVLTSDGTNWASTAPAAGVTPNNYISNLTLSAAGSTATFGIAVGVAMDSTNAALMTLGSAYTKTTSAWAVGSGNGSLDTGTIANSTWYHVWLIQRSDTLVVDVLVSTSATAPTMPTNYNRKRRIGAMKTNGSAQWIKFIQTGDYFEWELPIQDQNNSSGTAAFLLTLTVPPGVVVEANLVGTIRFPIPTYSALISSALVTQTRDTPVGNTTVFESVASGIISFFVLAMTNTSAQVRVETDETAPSHFRIVTKGWTDFRGANG